MYYFLRVNLDLYCVRLENRLKLSVYPPNINVLYEKFAVYPADLVGYTASSQYRFPMEGDRLKK